VTFLRRVSDRFIYHFGEAGEIEAIINLDALGRGGKGFPLPGVKIHDVDVGAEIELYAP
jgi:hypothetical protein